MSRGKLIFFYISHLVDNILAVMMELVCVVIKKLEITERNLKVSSKVGKLR